MRLDLVTFSGMIIGTLLAQFIWTAFSAAADAPIARKPKNSTITVQSSPDVTPERARRIAATVWPALSQREVDDVTARAKQQGPQAITIYCVDEAKCGDLVSSLENAFESAHWTVATRYTSSMIPAGMVASPKALKALSTIDPGYSLSADPEPDKSEDIMIGEKPKGRLE